MTIGERIKYRREELQLSQDELAHRIGYKSRSSINKIELNIYQLTQSKIKMIADALDTTPAYIMGWEDVDSTKMNQVCELFEECYGKAAFEAVQKFLKLDSSDQAVVVTMMNSLLTADKYKGKNLSSGEKKVI